MRPAPAFARALGLEPGSAEVAERLAASAPAVYRWRVDADGAYSKLTKGFDPWIDTSLRVGYQIRPGTTLTAATEVSRRFDLLDTYLEARLDHRFDESFSAYLLVAGTPDADYRPEIAYAGGFAGTAREADGPVGTTILTLDAARAYYTDNTVFTVTPGLVQYLADGRFWVTARWINVFDPYIEHEAGWSLRGDAQLTDELVVFAGYADAPDQRRRRGGRHETLFAGAALAVSDRVTLRASMAHEDRSVGYDWTGVSARNRREILVPSMTNLVQLWLFSLALSAVSIAIMALLILVRCIREWRARGLKVRRRAVTTWVLRWLEAATWRSCASRRGTCGCWPTSRANCWRWCEARIANGSSASSRPPACRPTCAARVRRRAARPAMLAAESLRHFPDSRDPAGAARRARASPGRRADRGPPSRCRRSARRPRSRIWSRASRSVRASSRALHSNSSVIWRRFRNRRCSASARTRPRPVILRTMALEALAGTGDYALVEPLRRLAVSGPPEIRGPGARRSRPPGTSGRARGGGGGPARSRLARPRAGGGGGPGASASTISWTIWRRSWATRSGGCGSAPARR
jgi:YaiO family outer membrane protein